MWVFQVDTFDDLAKGSLINNSDDLVAVSKMLPWYNQVLSILISNRILIMSAYLANSVDSLI